MTGMSEIIAGWAPGPTETTETIAAGPAVALSGLLDREPAVTAPGDPIPPLWHWLYFLDRPATSELGPDGHPAAGHFMPPIPQRRRMYAGGRASYTGAFRCRRPDHPAQRAGGRDGQAGAHRRAAVRDRPVGVHQGGRGDRDRGAGRGLPERPARGGRFRRPARAPARRRVPAPWQIQIVPDPVLLFRFSALTYNAHRIHYDADYATGVEGHPGLVVHGPLLALLCFELPRRQAPRQRVTQLSFRARSPVYVGQRCTVTGGPRDDGCAMQVAGPDGAVALTAEGRLSA